MLEPLAFKTIPREGITTRTVDERLKDWRHVYKPTVEQRVTEQARRCMGCGVPFCQSDYGCPVANMIPDWNDLVARERWEEAVELLHQTNSFPEFTGFLCPAPCENACVLKLVESAVTIKQIELHIVETGFARGYITPRPPVHLNGRRVAVVGSGPAGLAAAQDLRRSGYDVTVFERDDRIGGLLRYGIPDFKMEKNVIDRRLAQLEAEGVEFKTGVALGRDVALEDLRKEFNAVCLAIGAGGARTLAIPGADLKGVHLAMDYLTQQNRLIAGDTVAPLLSAAGKRVAILGGGDTGADCLGTALRQGCKAAFQIEIRGQPPYERPSEQPWPLPPGTLTTGHAHEEGGHRLWGVSTTQIVGRGGHVESLVGEQVVSGKRQPLILAVDMVIVATGFTGVERSMEPALPGVAWTRTGALACSTTQMTSLPGVFVAGDAKVGASLIVTAIADGRRAAIAVDRYLSRMQ